MNNTSDTTVATLVATSVTRSPNYITATIFWILFFVGVTGNSILISVNISRRSSKQVATQLFMISLATSDLGLLLGNTWIQAYLSAKPSFIFGSVMCKLTNFWALVASSCSILTLTTIGIDRFFSARRPGNSFISVRGTKAAIGCIWIVTLAIGIPAILFCDISVVSNSYISCSSAGASQSSLEIYVAFIVVMTYLIPLGVLLLSYFGIWYKLISAKKRITDSNSSDQQLSRKVAKMCTMVVGIFIVSWTPYQVNFLCLINRSNKTIPRSLSQPLFILASANSCINPIVYGFMWRPMKEAVLRIAGRCRNNRVGEVPTSPTRSTKINPAAVNSIGLF